MNCLYLRLCFRVEEKGLGRGSNGPEIIQLASNNQNSNPDLILSSTLMSTRVTGPPGATMIPGQAGRKHPMARAHRAEARLSVGLLSSWLAHAVSAHMAALALLTTEHKHWYHRGVNYLHGQNATDEQDWPKGEHSSSLTQGSG